MCEMVNIVINDKKYEVPKEYTILKAAREANINIPTLCFLEEINEIGACRMCLVELDGGKLQTACTLKVSEGLVVYTNTKKVRDARKVVLELILSNHDKSCLKCSRNRNCELQQLAEELNVEGLRFEGERKEYAIDNFSPSIVRDPNKCILCRRCTSVCQNIQTVSAIETINRGFETVVGAAFNKKLNETSCINCGQCINVCPVGALREKTDMDKVWEALNNPELTVIAQVAPAVRAALGEEFGLPIGTKVTGQMVAALKGVGFDKVFDTNTAADLTIMEEGTELVGRIKNGGKLPLITSCCPGWIKFAEQEYPQLLDNLSSCKSPHQMFGAVLKTYYAQKTEVAPSKMYVVSVMPCTAKKFESKREEMNVNGYKDVDAVITTRELAKMIKEVGIDFANISEEEFDNPMGEGTGAGAIFGATGGVMEAALRTVGDVIGVKDANIEYNAVRGVQGIKEASINLGDITVKAAVAHGLGNARKLLDQVVSGEKELHFIEIMACPGGCVTGGGQPIHNASEIYGKDLRVERAKTLYNVDKDMVLRKSHENPIVLELYNKFLEKPNSHKAHELLHTQYKPRKKYSD